MTSHPVPDAMAPLAHTIRRVLAAGVLLAAVPLRANEPVEAFAAFLETNAIPFDRARLTAAAMDGMLRVIDPGACRLSAEAAQALVAGGEPVFGACPAEVANATNRPSLDAVELWPEGLAYLKVNTLGPASGSEVLSHLGTLNDRTGVILDLRGADGADLEAVVALASPFRRAGEPLFVIRDLHGREVAAHSATSAVPFRVPLMILTDRGTRGAAEALAACCRGERGIMLIGARTRGEPQLRELLRTPDGQFVYLATRYLAPVGRPSYDGRGVEPDVEVGSMDPGVFVNGDSPIPRRVPSAKSVRDHELLLRVNHDVVLRRAVDILLGLKALNHAGL